MTLRDIYANAMQEAEALLIGPSGEVVLADLWADFNRRLAATFPKDKVYAH